jgi:hypothetical protein
MGIDYVKGRIAEISEASLRLNQKENVEQERGKAREECHFWP